MKNARFQATNDINRRALEEKSRELFRRAAEVKEARRAAARALLDAWDIAEL